MHKRSRQLKSLCVAEFGQFRQGRASRVTQPEQFGGFVERFARRVVDAFPKQRVLPDVLHPHQLGMAARDQQRDEWEFRRRRGQKRGQQMALKVVHAYGRATKCCCQRTRETCPYEQSARQTRPAGEGHHIDVGEANRRRFEQKIQQGDDAPNVVS